MRKKLAKLQTTHDKYRDNNHTMIEKYPIWKKYNNSKQLINNNKLYSPHGQHTKHKYTKNKKHRL